MTNDRLSGLALITGSTCMIITMAFHPAGHVPAAQLESVIPRLIAVHALSLAALPVMFLGVWGLSRRLNFSDPLATTGLAFYTFALLAVTNAAVADGLVTPFVLRQLVASTGSQAAIDGWQMVARYNFYVNQGYAQVFVGASALAIILWSASALRGGKLTRSLGTYGCILGFVMLIALFSGRLQLGAHVFGVIILGQVIWFIAAGTLLWRREQQVTAAAR